MKFDTSFSSWLGREMARRDWSQADLARQAGVTRGAISNLFTEYRRPGIELCLGLATALDYSITTILARAGYIDIDPNNKEEMEDEQLKILLKRIDPEDLPLVIDFINMVVRRRDSESKRGNHHGEENTNRIHQDAAE